MYRAASPVYHHHGKDYRESPTARNTKHPVARKEDQKRTPPRDLGPVKDAL
jgi:hypothetical protein